MSLPRILTIMGSGETAPTMVTTHRTLTSLLPKPVKAVVLDTPYGFQENAPELASRAVEYFHTSINVDLAVAGLVRLHDTHIAADPVAIERGLRTISDSDYIFAGPGSPTYALRQWAGSNVANIINGKLANGGIVTFASAAALTLGKATVPVYEIYKVGQNVELLDGLDILSTIGINAAVIPHYDNAEGGNHDTRFCYLGEKRLELFESMLSPETYVLGVDEHTGLVIDLDTEEAKVVGNGTVTIRLRDESHVYESGALLPLDVLRDPWNELSLQGSNVEKRTQGANFSQSDPSAAHSTSSDPSGVRSSTPSSLDEVILHTSTEFESALNERDAERAVRAALDLESAIRSWSADTLQGDGIDRARATLRSMISQLGDAAVQGVQDPRSVVGPYIEAMLAVRATVRAEKRYDLSDVIRDAFAALNVEVRDTPDGVQWSLPTN
jgi:cyanophycinase-like exopeptidase